MKLSELEVIFIKYHNYSPYCAYGEYDGLYDEVAHSLNAVGVTTDNEIIMSFDYKDLIRKDQCTSNVPFFIDDICNNFTDLYLHINYVQTKYEKELPIKIKGDDGKIYNIKDMVIDYKCKRIVFIADYKFK